jgi:hypothetical protein
MSAKQKPEFSTRLRPDGVMALRRRDRSYQGIVVVPHAEHAEP